MGHLLGTSSPGADALVKGVSVDTLHSEITWIEVNSLYLHHPDSAQVVGFAIDQPRVGDLMRGAGFEINGWVIGQGTAVRGVRTCTRNRTSPLYPLDVRRADVAADYPAYPHAVSSGFSAWAPANPDEPEWQIALEVVLANGDAVTLAEFQGQIEVKPRQSCPGNRVVVAPDFVIVGTQRGGTTSLHRYLSAHPRVLTPSTKELHFITDHYDRGLEWYIGQFPEHLPAGTLAGEATPYALFHPRAPRRLHEIAPRTKVIVLLRNPVDRAYSHYLLERSRGHEPLEFSAALDAESDRLNDEETKLSRDPMYKSKAHKHYSYVARGIYAPQLERWFACFPKEQILVVQSEDLYQRSAETYARVTAFLEIEPEIRISFSAYNQTSGPPLDPMVRDRLAQHFASSNALLPDLLGWDPGWT